MAVEEENVTREDLVAELQTKTDATGFWSDFNRKHRAWRNLTTFAKIRSDTCSFMNPDEVPPEPDPDDFDDLLA